MLLFIQHHLIWDLSEDLVLLFGATMQDCKEKLREKIKVKWGAGGGGQCSVPDPWYFLAVGSTGWGEVAGGRMRSGRCMKERTKHPSIRSRRDQEEAMASDSSSTISHRAGWS